MYKGIEWLKKEINTEMIELEPNRKERWSDVKYQTLRSVAQKIDQLDEPEVTLNSAFEKIYEIYPMTKGEVCRHLEQVAAHGGKVTYGEPEVLSQEWIDEHIDYADAGGDTSVYTCRRLKSLLVPKRGLPVIPKYVADWITQYRKVFDLYPALKKLENNSLIWELVYEWYRMNTHKFVNAYLTGEYEVKKEPLYYALIKGYEFPSGLLSIHDGHLTKMTKEDWNVFGINDSNADFVKVDE